MKVLLVNTYDRGGAANSCIRLHEGLLNERIDSKVLLRSKGGNIPFTQLIKLESKELTNFQKIKSKIRRILKELKLIKKSSMSKEDFFLRNRTKGLEMFSFPFSNFDITTSELYEQADIINLHWVANFLDYTSFFKKNTKPVVWTLHDMNPFSGGEHYEEMYLGIDEFGFPIKRKLMDEEKDIADRNIAIKLDAISKVNNLTIVAPSEWLAKEARKSVVFRNRPVYCIPYGLNAEIFSPRNKEFSRELLNIPKNKKVLLFVADSIDNNRKGFIFLQKAFELLTDTNLVLCAVGEKNTELEKIDNILELGVIKDEKLMSVVYSAADVFVIPSLIDNLPNTVLESLMCGTPVIGFPVGGIPDMIENDFNGIIIEEITVNSVVNAIKKIIDNSTCFDRDKIRENALKKYDKKVQAKNYIDLFDEILNGQIDK